jgi:hypothetical protein
MDVREPPPRRQSGRRSGQRLRHRRLGIEDPAVERHARRELLPAVGVDRLVAAHRVVEAEAGEERHGHGQREHRADPADPACEMHAAKEWPQRTGSGRVAASQLVVKPRISLYSRGFAYITGS